MTIIKVNTMFKTNRHKYGRNVLNLFILHQTLLPITLNHNPFTSSYLLPSNYDLYIYSHKDMYYLSWGNVCLCYSVGVSDMRVRQASVAHDTDGLGLAHERSVSEK